MGSSERRDRAMDASTVRLERSGPVASIVVDRPEARNALTTAMRATIMRLADELSRDTEIRVVVLRGSGGKVFLSGADLREFAEQPGAAEMIEMARRDEELYQAIEGIPAVTVAAIEGHALGGGLALATVCDLRICSADAVLGIPGAKLGNCLSPGMYARLATLIGPARMKQLLLTAEPVSAQTGLELGLVGEVVERQRFESRLEGLVEGLAGMAPLSVWATKEATRRLRPGYPAEEDILERVLGSDDFKEGLTAYAEKRAPRWSGH